MEPLRPNGDRARILKIMLWVMLSMEIISALTGFSQLGLLMEIQDGVEVGEATANLNDLMIGVTGLVYAGVYFTCVVMFIRWFRRAYFNLHQRVKHLEFREEWAAGAWFVPFVNLVRPFAIMKELYVETRDLFAKHNITQPTSLSTAFLGFWWAFWIIMGIVGNISFRLTLKAKTVPELITSTEVDIVANLVAIPAALLAIKVVADYAKVEGLLFEVKEEVDTIAASGQ
jgi:hypothetical protein